MSPKRIIISRTDSIGDVMLTLPLCGVIKKHLPDTEIIFLGRTYTEPIIQACTHVDHFENWDNWRETNPQNQIEQLQKWHADAIIHVFPRKEILWVAKRAGIPYRVATGRRVQTITKCNKLVFFTRKHSKLHESQLNLKLLSPFSLPTEVSLDEIKTLYGLNSGSKQEFHEFLNRMNIRDVEGKKLLILHPLSQGSAVEWGLLHYQQLCDLLPPEQWSIFITGTKAEGDRMRAQHTWSGKHVRDMCGMMSLSELILFISGCRALVAASTGPLHIAAALGIQAIGLYSPKRPIHPGRWAPVGNKAFYIEAKVHPVKGHFLAIEPAAVAQLLQSADT